MLGSILPRRGLFEKITEIVRDFFGDDLCSLIVFGSSVYYGRGRDLDLIVIVKKKLNMKEKLRLEYRLSRKLGQAIKDTLFDVHVFDIESFNENLQPDTFLGGLALGYIVLYDKINIEKHIFEFLKKLSHTERVLINKYGEWNLNHHAKIILKLKSKKAKTIHSINK